MDFPALALLEFNSIATGIMAGDAMVKRAPVSRIQTGTVQPGHYLVLVVGDVAPVQEAVHAGKEIGQAALRDMIFLPNVHHEVVRALGGERQVQEADALGVVETQTVAAAIHAADAGVKGAEVSLLQLRLADGLGGKGLVLFTGLVADVETAVALGTAVASPHLLRQAVIPQLHPEMWDNVNRHGRFGGHFSWEPA
ncbi:MAG: BMC domain-containing protein [Chloroflexi bacterium]|nr:BMC domain-containing protein [Ardenticatenaceae bacterium]MBL1128855.1 BMC domain-containing protein [Chloroflexota bacterium]NOG34932.1 BMC domain-containing protein [Chloroflexota bacterium]GIK58095.1 MAG: propanediol utilization: polyhedral bodies pduT [Chloroflexota bacterium]